MIPHGAHKIIFPGRHIPGGYDRRAHARPPIVPEALCAWQRDHDVGHGRSSVVTLDHHLMQVLGPLPGRLGEDDVGASPIFTNRGKLYTNSGRLPQRNAD